MNRKWMKQTEEASFNGHFVQENFSLSEEKNSRCRDLRLFSPDCIRQTVIILSRSITPFLPLSKCRRCNRFAYNRMPKIASIYITAANQQITTKSCRELLRVDELENQNILGVNFQPNILKPQSNVTNVQCPLNVFFLLIFLISCQIDSKEIEGRKRECTCAGQANCKFYPKNRLNFNQRGRYKQITENELNKRKKKIEFAQRTG